MSDQNKGPASDQIDFSGALPAPQPAQPSKPAELTEQSMQRVSVKTLKQHEQNWQRAPLSPDQAAAVQTVKTETGPFFLTGPAGSGKSYVIDYLNRTVPRSRVTAMTGMAAQLIGGVTLHSFASIHPNYGAVPSEKGNTRVRNCDLLIIDEISMCEWKVLIQLYQRFRMAGHTPKLLAVGDFMQLPPVEGVQLFETRQWNVFKKLELTTQHRQQQMLFIDILGDIRLGRLTPRVQELLNNRWVQALPDNCTQLYALRAGAAELNKRKLEELPGPAFSSDWVVRYSEGLNDPVVNEKNVRFPKELRIKPGARVVMLTNEPSGRWVNGSTGYVRGISPGAFVTVELDAGHTVQVFKAEEEVLSPDNKPLATVLQYPMMLAWALTIHKAQGMTLDRVGVDLSNHFERGQTYVALSRCRSMEGLFVTGQLNYLLVNESALAYYGV